MRKIIFSGTGVMLSAVNVYAKGTFSLEEGSGAPVMAIMLVLVLVCIVVGALFALKSLIGIRKSGVVEKSGEEEEKRFSKVFTTKEEIVFKKKPEKETKE